MLGADRRVAKIDGLVPEPAKPGMVKVTSTDKYDLWASLVGHGSSPQSQSGPPAAPPPVRLLHAPMSSLSPPLITVSLPSLFHFAREPAHTSLLHMSRLFPAQNKPCQRGKNRHIQLYIYRCHRVARRLLLVTQL